MSLDEVRKVADAVLYEGYILYPYRASSQKNHSRWQFGVLMPPAYTEADPSENSALQAECVFEHYDEPAVEVTLRFLQVQRRRTEGTAPGPGSTLAPDARDASARDAASAGDASARDAASATDAPTPAPGRPASDPLGPAVWDEAVEQEVTVVVPSTELLGPGAVLQFAIPGGDESETVPGARVVRRREPLTGSIAVTATPLPGPWQAARLTVQAVNESPAAASSRGDALPAALVAAHLIITVSGGAFLSMTDPPEWASHEVAACQNTGCWPVLAGPEGTRQVMLASPIILPEHAQIAAESPGELYDGTEIDEILTLRTLALSDEEKAAARATDPRAAALIDRVDAMDAPTMEQLHGTIRAMTGPRSGSGSPGPGLAGTGPADTGLAGAPALDGLAGLAGAEAGVPWWDPGADASVSPATDFVVVSGQRVACGSRVILRPGARRADAQDMFLAGRAARVEAVLIDVDDTSYLAVTLADDPAADLQSAHGRFLYFSPDEVEPCAEPGSGETAGAAEPGRTEPGSASR
jgi:hypothetical protein